jgi:hypothetical protein
MSNGIVVLVCGDRHWTNRISIAKRLKQLPANTLILHGGARGADMLAGEEATKLGLKVEVFPAEWEKYGQAAGPVRNVKMLDMNPHLVIAFHSDLAKSRGTAHTVREARKRQIRVHLVTA